MKQRIIHLVKSNSVKQLVKYGLVGFTGIIIDMGIFYLLDVVLSVQYPFSSGIKDLTGGQMSLNVINTAISHIISSVLAITNNFILNSYFTFKVTDDKIKRFFSFIGVAAVGLVISTTMITLFVGKLEMDEMLSKVLATCIVAAMQFLVNKFFTFRKKQIE